MIFCRYFGQNMLYREVEKTLVDCFNTAIHCITRREVYVLFFCMYHKTTYIPPVYRSVKDIRQCNTPSRLQNVYLTWIIIKDCVHALYWHLLLIFVVIWIDILKLKYQKKMASLIDLITNLSSLAFVKTNANLLCL